jgi:TatA/E family protein of Tat protein translocase
MSVGPWEIVILLVILVIIFGAQRLTQVGGAMGQSVREFRGAVKETPRPAPVPVVTVPPVICGACQTSNLGTNKFCSGCGATLLAGAPVAVAAEVETAEPAAATPVVAPTPAVQVEVERTCPSCATPNPPGQPFCGQCGTPLTTAAA